jgi:hypothetical protein
MGKGKGKGKGNAVAGTGTETGTVATPVATVAVRKVRTMQNGVKHPLPGGKCYAVWAFCDSVLASSGAPPSTAQVAQHSAQQGWNRNNTTIELSYWRKYHGIPARTVAQVATAEVPQA